MHVIQVISPQGGPGRHALEICGGLAKLGVDRQTLILSDRPYRSFLDSLPSSVSVRVLSQGNPPISRMESMFRLLGDANADVVHVHYPSMALPLWLRGLTSKLVCTLHGHPQVMIEPKLWMKIGYLGELLSLKLIAQNVPLVSVSEFTSRNVRKIAGKPSRVVYPGIDVSVFTPPPNKTSAKQKLGFDRQFIVLYVGRIHPYKDPMTLVRAMAALPRDLSKLIIVGEGPILPQVQKGLEKFDINYDHVPRLKVTDLVGYYQAADVFVLPSIGEAAGIVIIEAMSCGLPVISTNVGGPPEIVGNAGLYFSPGNARQLADKLTLVMGDESLRRNLSEMGRRRVEAMFSNLTMASNYLEIYQRILDENIPT